MHNQFGAHLSWVQKSYGFIVGDFQAIQFSSIIIINIDEKSIRADSELLRHTCYMLYRQWEQSSAQTALTN